jgi:hypothetical protein
MSETGTLAANTLSPEEKEPKKKRKLPKGMTPWKKGQSGNPNGRRKADILLSELAKVHTEDVVRTLADIVMNKNATPSARVAAASELLDRGWGRAPQHIELNQNVTFSAQFEEFINDLHKEHQSHIRAERAKVIEH